MTPLRTAEPIAGYTVTERIGAGGYGEVWRAEARATKNWPMSDKIRDRLKELKVVVEDRPDGVTWRRDG